MDLDQEDSTFDSERFILSNHEAIKKRVNLDVLVPKLYNKGLLTNDEREELLFEQREPHKRKKKLVEIVASKGDTAPRLLIECLREANEHLPHSELASILERSLQSHGVSRSEPVNTANQRPVSSHSAASDASADSALPQFSRNQASSYTQNPIHGLSTSAALGRSSQMPLCNHDRMIPTGHPSTTGGVSPFTHSLEQLQRTSPEFASLILGLASELNQVERGTTFESIGRTLLALLEFDGIPIQLPSQVTDFPTLILHLRRLKMCHESDVDLLCKLLDSLEQDDLRDAVKAYAAKMISTDVMRCRYQRSSPSHHHFIAFTFHNVPSLSLGAACEIKHFMSDLLHIPRHCFTLVGSEEGSIGLAWQIPVKYRKHMQLSLMEDENVKTSLTSSSYQFESIKLEIEDGSERVVAFTRPAGSISDAHVRMTECTCSSTQDPCGQCCISSQEDAVSSTVDDLSSIDNPLKRSRSPSYHESDGDARPPPAKQPSLNLTTGQGKRKRPSRESIQLPPSKQQHFQDQDYQSPTVSEFERFSETTPDEFASQYIPNPYSDDSPLSVLRRTLRDSYRSRNFFQKAAGPGVGRVRFINLALVKKQNVSENEKEIDRFLKQTLHGSIDDIIRKKEDIKVNKIFSYEGEDSRKLVLVEGAPGVGKTMLALKLCSDWGKGDALQEFDLVLLIQLRRFQGMKKITLEDIVRVYLDQPELATEISKELYKRHNKVLLILEGWDELPPQLRKEMTFFFDIITGDKLPNASVMVTSRPTVTSDLYDYMDERHIEVLGFSPPEIKRYVKEHAKSKAKSILEHLNRFPNLKALAHIPLTLAIICRLANDQIELPPTLTELYNNHICNLLHQNLKKCVSLLGVGGLDKLPKENREVIESLSKLALKGMEDKSFVFKKEDLKEVGLDPKENFDGYGLLSTPIVAATAGREVYYQFGHLSIQEFLAAYQIKQLKSATRIELLKEFREDKQFQNVWKFLSGITKLKEEEFQEAIISNTSADNRDQMFLIHCLFEAHDKEICQEGAAKLKRNLNINNMSLNTTDCLCAAYVITTAGGDWMVDLRGCNIGADGMDVFRSHFESHMKIPEAERTDFRIKELNLTHNRISKQAAVHIAEILKMDVHMVRIMLGSNALGKDGLVLLADALSENKTVTAIHFSTCELTPACGEHFANMLKQNKTLKELYLGFEPLGDEGVCAIISALKENSTLVDLSLSRTEFSVEGLKYMTEVIPQNKKLEVIRFDRDEIGPDQCPLLARLITMSESLVLIDLSKNPIGDKGFEILLDALIAKPKGPIKKLGVFGCEISSKSLTKLVEFFAVAEVFEGIQLGCNQLGEKGAELIGKALQANASKSVRQILLEATDIPQGAQDRLADIVKELKADPGREKLDVNYLHHGQVIAQAIEREKQASEAT